MAAEGALNAAEQVQAEQVRGAQAVLTKSLFAREDAAAPGRRQRVRARRLLAFGFLFFVRLCLLLYTSCMSIEFMYALYIVLYVCVSSCLVHSLDNRLSACCPCEVWSTLLASFVVKHSAEIISCSRPGKLYDASLFLVISFHFYLFCDCLCGLERFCTHFDKLAQRLTLAWRRCQTTKLISIEMSRIVSSYI